MSNNLRALRDIISSSIDSICDVCEQTGKAFASLDDPIDPSEFTSHGIRSDPAVSRSINLIVAAATQLIATVRDPAATAVISAYSYAMTAALGVVEAGNVPEILRDAGPHGLHLNDIAARSNMDPKKLGRILRYLATQHWFREVSPDVFSNNLLSSTLDSGKDITKGLDPGAKYDNPKGMSAIIGFAADEFAKSGSYLVETMTDPKTRFSETTDCSALQKALNTTETFFEFYDKPTEQYRRNRFATAMACINNVNRPAMVLSGFDWAELPEGGIVVDVGGGLGHVTMEIAKAHPRLQVVVEDRELIIKQAEQYWRENLPSHVSENKVHFIATDFFEEQPKLPGPVDVFLLRHILHDWSDELTIKVLRRLRDAAGPTTKLIIIEAVMEHACGSEQRHDVRTPLLRNLGGANLFSYATDLIVFGVLNTGERTEQGFKDVLSASGWQLQEIRRNPTGLLNGLPIISVPV